jgi:hypothetical protein
MKNISDKICRENRKTYFMYRNFFCKILPFMRSGKIVRAGQATDGNKAPANCMLDT